MVLPLEKRPKVLEIGHDSMWTGHLGVRKTNAHVKISYWPGMAGNIRKYCQSSEACQSRSPITAADRVPITTLVHPEVPLLTVFINCVGALEP